MDNWISVSNKLPPYGDPVLLIINGAVQHITYMLDCHDESPDWFEPYHFDHDDELKIWYNKVDSWQPLPSLPLSKPRKLTPRKVVRKYYGGRGKPR